MGAVGICLCQLQLTSGGSQDEAGPALVTPGRGSQ